MTKYNHAVLKEVYNTEHIDENYTVKMAFRI